MMSDARPWLCLLLGLMLSACATVDNGLPRPAGPADSPTKQAEPASPPPATQPRQPSGIPPLSAAAQALQDQADQASAEGDHDRAAALLERALAVAPDHPLLWHNLAIVHYRKGDYRQAEVMALRSADHGAREPALVRRNWELIATSRELAGDRAGAADARRRLEAIPAGQSR